MPGSVQAAVNEIKINKRFIRFVYSVENETFTPPPPAKKYPY